MRWAVGVTTVPARRDTLAATLRSLGGGGFSDPRLFVDEAPALGAWGRWFLAVHELLIREPRADRFAVFQDDVLCSRNLRRYLDAVRWPERCYWNLFTCKGNERLSAGVHPALEPGRGAQGLAFDRAGLHALVTSLVAVEHPMDARNPTRNIDGIVHTAMTRAGHREHVIVPSPLQHAGKGRSTLELTSQLDAPSWRGEGFDLTGLL